MLRKNKQKRSRTKKINDGGSVWRALGGGCEIRFTAISKQQVSWQVYRHRQNATYRSARGSNRPLQPPVIVSVMSKTLVFICSFGRAVIANAVKKHLPREAGLMETPLVSTDHHNITTHVLCSRFRRPYFSLLLFFEYYFCHLSGRSASIADEAGPCPLMPCNVGPGCRFLASCGDRQNPQ